MKIPIYFIASAMFVAPMTAIALDSTAFESTPAYVDNFTGGTPTLNWIIDPDAAAAVSSLVAPTFVTTTPAGIDPDIVADNPVASTDGVMLVGGNIADAGTHFGLNYVIADNALNGGGGDDLTALVNYKVVARIWTLGTSEYNTQGVQDRWAMGPYLHAGSGAGNLFRATQFYQVGSLGAGPGWYTRGLAADFNFTTTPLTNGDWRLFTVMVDGDEVAVGYDADGNGTINESDPLEFNGTLARDTVDSAGGAPGINCVGEVSNDLFPIFVDSFEIYLSAAPLGAEQWELFE